MTKLIAAFCIFSLRSHHEMSQEAGLNEKLMVLTKIFSINSQFFSHFLSITRIALISHIVAFWTQHNFHQLSLI